MIVMTMLCFITIVDKYFEVATTIEQAAAGLDSSLYSGIESISRQGYLARVRTEIWLWFSRLFQDIITSYSSLFRAFCEQDITKLAFKRSNLLYNVFIYSNYRIGLKFLNFKL